MPPLVTLAPGTDLRIQQNVDVNVVFVGMGGLVDPQALLAEAPMVSWNGVPQANGRGQTFMGQRFDFHYHVTVAPAWFEGCAPRVNRRFITQSYLLDATAVEKVLSQNLPSLLGVDVTKPTIVLMNW